MIDHILNWMINKTNFWLKTTERRMNCHDFPIFEVQGIHCNIIKEIRAKMLTIENRIELFILHEEIQNKINDFLHVVIHIGSLSSGN